MSSPLVIRIKVPPHREETYSSEERSSSTPTPSSGKKEDSKLKNFVQQTLLSAQEKAPLVETLCKLKARLETSFKHREELCAYLSDHPRLTASSDTHMYEGQQAVLQDLGSLLSRVQGPVLSRQKEELEKSAQPLETQVNREIRLTRIFYHAVHIAYENSLRLPSDFQDVAKWLLFFEEISKKRGSLSPDLPRSLRDLFERGKKLHDLSSFVKEEMDSFTLEPQVEEDDFSSQVEHSLKEEQERLENSYREKYHSECLAQLELHSIRDFIRDHYAATHQTEFLQKLEEIAQKIRQELRHELEILKNSFADRVRARKTTFLQNVQALGLKLPRVPAGLPLLDSMQTRREFYARLAVRNSFATVPVDPQRGEDLQILAREYDVVSKSLQGDWLKHWTDFYKLQKKTTRGLAQVFPYKLGQKLGAGAGTVVSEIAVYKPLESLPYSAGSFRVKRKAIKIPNFFVVLDSFQREATISTLLRRSHAANVLFVQTVKLLGKALEIRKESIQVSSANAETKEYEPIGGLMELCEPNCLYLELLKNPTLSLSQRMHFALDVAKGLSFLHENQYCHADLKSANILLKKDEQGNFYAILSDFGSSFPAGSREGYTSTYIAPEQYEDILSKSAIVVRKETDMYFFGNLLAELKWKKDVLRQYACTWQDMLANGEIHRTYSVRPDPKIASRVQSKYLRLSQKIVKEGSIPGSDRLDQLIGQLFTLDPSRRPDAKAVVTLLEQGVQALRAP